LLVVLEIPACNLFLWSSNRNRELYGWVGFYSRMCLNPALPFPSNRVMACWISRTCGFSLPSISLHLFLDCLLFVGADALFKRVVAMKWSGQTIWYLLEV
jgi:hypothetical protein